MFQLHSELRSITSLCVVEEVSKCPLGYTPIVRTHDQELDADLWKDGFFGKRITRYVCISKSQGKPEHVIQDIQILNDKELPPEGFSILHQTSDTSQKAFKKKQLCFKHTHYKINVDSVVDVVILTKLKNPPDGYDHIGDINGMHFLVKKVSALTRLSNPTPQYALPGLFAERDNTVYPSLHDSMNNININSNGNTGNNNNGHRMSLPNNHSPYSSPNTPHTGYSYSAEQKNNVAYNTMSSSNFTGIEGIPFVLRDDLRSGVSSGIMSPGSLKFALNIKSQIDVEREYQYDFRAERDVLFSNGL